MKDIIAVLGETASGKTDLALKLALKEDGEILNFDLYQMYKEFDIGTNKKIDQRVKHHFFSFLDPTTSYSIYQFQIDGRKRIDEILKRGKKVILVGGSFLYLSALLYDYRFVSDCALKELSLLSLEEMQEKVKSLDIKLPDNFDFKNKRRLIRVLASGGNLDFKHADHLLYDVSFIAIKLDKEILEDKINKRVIDMLNNGWINEVKELREKYPLTLQPFQALGYLDIVSFLDNKISYDQLIQTISLKIRRYAKRQRTWLRHHYDCAMYQPPF
jgi:tRNA dimethylallyltransferase